eukprot:PhF_6_TR18551/c0_g1_i1/m.27097
MNRTKNAVSLNVGGRYFTTLKSTLTQQNQLPMLQSGDDGTTSSPQGNFFTALFSMPDDMVDWDPLHPPYTTYFIDRSGEMFEIILRYLRENTWVIPSNCSYTSSALFREAHFYGIDIGVSDATIPYLIHSRNITSDLEFSVLRPACEWIHKTISDRVREGKPLSFVVTPTIEQVKATLRSRKIQTSENRLDGIDVAQLAIPVMSTPAYRPLVRDPYTVEVIQDARYHRLLECDGDTTTLLLEYLREHFSLTIDIKQGMIAF